MTRSARGLTVENDVGWAERSRTSQKGTKRPRCRRGPGRRQVTNKAPSVNKAPGGQEGVVGQGGVVVGQEVTGWSRGRRMIKKAPWFSMALSDHPAPS